jgi:hypothetical protein
VSGVGSVSDQPPATSRATFLSLPLGSRVVVRYRIPGGATDVLGELTRMSATECDVLARSGVLVTVVLANIVAAKAVPPPPVRRPGRRDD